MSQAAASAAQQSSFSNGGFPRGHGFEQTMTRSEAEHILGVYSASTSYDSREEIIKRHRQLMKINHPDNRGSIFIASKINEAKDLLLKD